MIVMHIHVSISVYADLSEISNSSSMHICTLVSEANMLLHVIPGHKVYLPQCLSSHPRPG